MLLEILLRTLSIVALTAGAYLLTRMVVSRFVLPLVGRKWPAWASAIRQSRLPMLTALLVSTLTLGAATILLAGIDYPQITDLIRVVDTAASIAIFTFMLTTTTSIALSIYNKYPLAKEVPLNGFAQLVQVCIYLVGGLVILATFMGVPAAYSLTALAALFAALGFVFQDPIMGFVAGIQLAANKMVAIGDRIEVAQYGANGIVEEILMSTVKVRNFDNTITTVPTRSLISGAFQNWRTVTPVTGRRVQRNVLLDVRTVRPLTPELLASYPHLAAAWQQIEAGALTADGVLADEALAQPTNLGVYRVVLTDYLQRHSRIVQNMAHVAHQLQMEEYGVPLEIYAYLSDTGLPRYETTISSIFEHVFATLPAFGLRVYQRPQDTDAATANV